LIAKAAGRSGGFFRDAERQSPHFVALQPMKCCYANKTVVAGIWYT
jgi:hypothetical protein